MLSGLLVRSHRRRSRLERVDRVGEGDRPLRTLDVEILDKFAIDEDDALARP